MDIFHYNIIVECMNTENNNYAILQKFQQLQPIKLDRLIMLTKSVLVFQNNANIEFLHVSNARVSTFLVSTESDALAKEPVMLCEIFNNNYAVFAAFNSLTKRTSKINKLPKLLKEQLTGPNTDDPSKIQKFLNIICIINQITSTLRNKTVNKIIEYRLFDKLNEINPNLITLLGLADIQSIKEDDHIKSYIEDLYNYKNVGIQRICDCLSDADYDAVHALFMLFK